MGKRTKIIVIVLWIIAFWIAFFSFAFYTREKYIEVYNEGVSLLEAGKYDEAIDCFDDIPNFTDYRDVGELLEERGYSICPHCGALLE